MDRQREEVTRLLRRRPGAPWFPDELGILDANNTENILHTDTAGPFVILDIAVPFRRALGALILVSARRDTVNAAAEWVFHALWSRAASPAAPVSNGFVSLGGIFVPPFGAGDVTFGVSADGGTVLVTPPAVLTDPTTWTARAILYGTDG